MTIMSHRLVWCCVVVNGWQLSRGRFAAVRVALADRGTRLRLIGSALLISTNWLVYVWAVGSGHVIDSSLGYFINPLVNVLLGVLVLGERLNRIQWVAVAWAGAGVAWLTIQTGTVPWIALALALSFGGYGLIRKIVSVDAVSGLAAETALLAPFAVAWLTWAHVHGDGAFGGANVGLQAWLVAGGVVTAVPLALFAFGARRIRYSTVGLVQYVGPTLQLLLGVFLFGETFASARAVGFGMIWTALALYAGDSLWREAQRGPGR